MKSLNLRRLLAYLIDIVIVGVIASLISFIPFVNPNRDSYQKKYDELIELYDKYDQKQVSDSEYKEQYIRISYDLNRINVNYVLIDVVIIVAYFGIFAWQRKGQTFGKRFMKLRIVSNKDGGNPSFVTLFLRALILNNVIITLAEIATIFVLPVDNYYTIYSNINLVGYIVLYIIVFLILVRQDSRGLHDLVAGTKVIMLDEEKKESPTLKEEVEVVKEEVEEAKFEPVKKTTKKKSTKSKK